MIRIEDYGLRFGATSEAQSEVDLASLVETHSEVLFRVAYSLLRNRSEAEDVVQEVFLRVLQRRGMLREVREMRVWLVRIAWNLALDRRRRIRPEQMGEEFVRGLAGAQMAADVALVEAERIGAVLREMDRLPKGERAVLLLSVVEELGTREMAEVLGRSESAVRALLSRARARLSERVRRTEGAGDEVGMERERRGERGDRAGAGGAARCAGARGDGAEGAGASQRGR